MVVRALATVALLAVVGHAKAAKAAEPAAQDAAGEVATTARRLTLNLETALALAARQGPELGPARAGVAGSVALANASGGFITRPPELTVSAGPRFGVDHGLDATISLLQPLSLGGAGQSRGRLAETRRAIADAVLLQARARNLLLAAAAWVEARLSRELMLARQVSLTEAQTLLAVADARLDSGAATAGEQALTRALVGAARAALLDAEGRRFAADTELNYELGLEEVELDVTGALDADGAALDERTALELAERHPALTALRAEARAAEDAVTQARAEGAPYLAVGPSLTREGTGDYILLGHVGVALPFVNPNAFEAGERARVARIAQAEVERGRLRLRADVLSLLHERTHARLARDALVRDAVGPARDALTAATNRYREGKAPLADVLVARRGLLEVEERHLEASAAARLAELKLRAAVGRLAPEVP